ncbi:unnamed protein product [Clonostachys solani]|uniref:Glutathione synthetase n=1 Tax=Clonostachys solani TaxID=160281 RepID=A0A9N9Z1G8_9HYPO|nr:unnamed protein product [Clonostachys solani]
MSSVSNKLYAAIASDEKWLGSVVRELARIDPFIAKLWKVHETAKKTGCAQDLELGIFRSDYMLHQTQIPSLNSKSTELQTSIKQIEINLNSPAFGGMSPRVASLHRYLYLTKLYLEDVVNIIHDDERLPQNNSTKQIAAGLAIAHAEYGLAKQGRDRCILLVVQEGEQNVYDQRHIESALFSIAQVKTVRLTFDGVDKYAALDNENRLVLDLPSNLARRNKPREEVTVVYFRAGQSPDEYDNNSCMAWKVRTLLEKSRAIKCPSILAHLAGLKKIQQVLATPDSTHLARFLPNPVERQRVRATFARMYPMDASLDGLLGREIALDKDKAKHFVLKPQREAGGDNIYGEAIPRHLMTTAACEWPAYVLTELIKPPAQMNVILKDGKAETSKVVSELGVFGTVLWRKKADNKMEIVENQEAGWLLRTKSCDSDEGGVAAGFGSLDSVCLVKNFTGVV